MDSKITKLKMCSLLKTAKLSGAAQHECKFWTGNKPSFLNLPNNSFMKSSNSAHVRKDKFLDQRLLAKKRGP
jgi:hypothetical protein